MTKMESIQVVLSNAELLYSEQEIDSALEKIAIQLTTEYKGANPLNFMCYDWFVNDDGPFVSKIIVSTGS